MVVFETIHGRALRISGLAKIGRRALGVPKRKIGSESGSVVRGVSVGCAVTVGVAVGVAVTMVVVETVGVVVVPLVVVMVAVVVTSRTAVGVHSRV